LLRNRLFFLYLGALRGNLHGGANEAAMDFLEPLKSIK
jgi:citrate synthase